jgi:secreted Zn-dependent insulinase-like peptidase
MYIPQICSTPLKRAKNAVFIDVLIEKFTKKIGYEATLADMAY